MAQQSLQWQTMLVLAALSATACKGSGAERGPADATGAAQAATSASAPANEIDNEPDEDPPPPTEPTASELAEGTPLSITPQQQQLGALKFTAQRCEMEGGPLIGKDTTSLLGSIVVHKNRLYVFMDDDQSLRAYRIRPGAACRLVIDRQFGDAGVVKLTGSFRRLSGDSAGNLWLSSSISASSRYNTKGEKTAACSANQSGHLFVHPGGQFGLSLTSTGIRKIGLPSGDGSCTSEDWVYRNLHKPSERVGPFVSTYSVDYDGDDILLGAGIAKEVDPKQPKVLAVLDAAGKEKLRLTAGDGDQRLGWIHASAACKPGYCILDSNFRHLSVWKKDGSFVGVVSLSRLFGLQYPWIADFKNTPHGAWFIAAQKRADNDKVAEGHIYRVGGL